MWLGCLQGEHRIAFSPNSQTGIAQAHAALCIRRRRQGGAVLAVSIRRNRDRRHHDVGEPEIAAAFLRVGLADVGQHRIGYVLDADRDSHRVEVFGAERAGNVDAMFREAGVGQERYWHQRQRVLVALVGVGGERRHDV